MDHSLISLQNFLCIVTVTMMTLVAALTERDRAEEELRGLNATLERRVAERTKTLEEQAQEVVHSNSELERFNRVAVGREERMVELKRRINELSKKLGEPLPYDLSFIEEEVKRCD